jgi:hypothetical protein
MWIFHLSHAFYMPRSSPTLWIHRHNNVLWWVGTQISKHFIVEFSPFSCHFLQLMSSTFFSHSIRLCSSLRWDTKFHTHTKQQLELYFYAVIYTWSSKNRITKWTAHVTVTETEGRNSTTCSTRTNRDRRIKCFVTVTRITRLQNIRAEFLLPSSCIISFLVCFEIKF